MSVRSQATGWRVIPPSHRFDIAGEHDLIEEVARVHGLDRFPSRAPSARGGRGGRRETELDRHRFRQLLVDRDYQEVITYSFVDPNLQRAVEPEDQGIALVNPIASNMAEMRTSMIPGLLAALDSNNRRQRRRIRLFEIGHVFRRVEGDRVEIPRIAGIACGPAAVETWDSPPRAVDFFDVKGDVEALFGLGGRGREFTFASGRHPALHPGQSARIESQGRQVGIAGRLHPHLLHELDIETDVYVFELDLAELELARMPAYAPISRHPATRRDISVVVDDGVAARDVRDTIAAAAGEVLKSLELFDVYRGPGVPEGRKSLSYALTLQRSSSNLKDIEIEEISGRVVAALGSRLNGELRT
jgi:phenylalanyl-tRNA synthetase beta chain